MHLAQVREDAHGVWASTLYESLLVVFALAASVPHRAPVGGDIDASLPRVRITTPA